MDYANMLQVGGYDFALVVTCGLIRFIRLFAYTRQV